MILNNLSINLNEINNVSSKEYDRLYIEGLDFMDRKRLMGKCYRICNMWYDKIPMIKGPVKYMEIGVYYGINAISVANSYCSDKDSEIHCIDPWKDYEDYVEYKTEMNEIYTTCILNIIMSGELNKFYIHRGLSSDEVPKLKDEYFDIIYIDGNHNPCNVLEDAVLSYKKLKKGGYIIFDDYGWVDTSIGIKSFLNSYIKSECIELISIERYQCIVKKIKGN